MDQKALEHILAARDKDGPFESLFDFTSRVDLRAVNKRVLESLIMAGAMDSLAGTRAEKFATIDIALRYGQQIQENRHRNQVDLFGQASNGESSMVPELVNAESWSDSVSLQKEKEVLGLYLSGHPLLKYAEDLEEFSNFDFSENVEELKLDIVRIGGSIQEFKLHFDRKNNQMAFSNWNVLAVKPKYLRLVLYLISSKIYWIMTKLFCQRPANRHI